MKKITVVLLSLIILTSCSNKRREKKVESVETKQEASTDLKASLEVPESAPSNSCVAIKIILKDKDGNTKDAIEDLKVDIKIGGTGFFGVITDDCNKIIQDVSFKKGESEKTVYITTMKEVKAPISVGISKKWYKSEIDDTKTISFSEQLESVEFIHGENLEILGGYLSDDSVKVKAVNKDGSPAQNIMIIFSSSNKNIRFSLEQKTSMMEITNSEGIAEMKIASPAVKKKMKFNVQAVSHKNPKIRDSIEAFIIN